MRDMEPFRNDIYSALGKTRTGGARVFHTNPPSDTRVRATFPFYAYGAATARAAFRGARRAEREINARAKPT